MSWLASCRILHENKYTPPFYPSINLIRSQSYQNHQISGPLSQWPDWYAKQMEALDSATILSTFFSIRHVFKPDSEPQQQRAYSVNSQKMDRYMREETLERGTGRRLPRVPWQIFQLHPDVTRTDIQHPTCRHSSKTHPCMVPEMTEHQWRLRCWNDISRSQF